MALEKTSGYKTGKALAREMVKALKGTPYDLKKPIPFSFYLYVPDKRKATTCAKILKTDGYEAVVQKSAAGDGKWLCLCHATLKAAEPAVASLGDRLIALAKEHGGNFDGWETNPYKNPGALDDLLKLIAEFQKQAKKK